MPTFEFNVTGGTNNGNFSISNVTGTLTGTIGGQNFTFSYSAAGARGVGTDILLDGSFTFSTFTFTPTFSSFVATPTSTATIFSGAFAFTDPNAFFSNFQLNGAGLGISNLTVTTAGSAQQSAMLNSNFGGNVVGFTISGNGINNNLLDSVTSDGILCYCAGTRIATPEGFKLVEDLEPGDMVCRADGGITTVQWLGEQTISPKFSHPAKVNPIRFEQGALGDNLPERDLLVSPDHGIAIDGLLINASALVNGRTIRQEREIPLESFTYYHVETEAHELLLAEGVAAESYLDLPARDRFDNGAERADAPPNANMPIPRISSRRLVPRQILERLPAQDDAQAA